MRFNSIFTRARLFVAALPLGIWLLLSGTAGGIFGLGVFTFAYAQGFSYLSDDPGACANCHAMRDVYDGWNHGSHKAIATCNDCHLPHAVALHYGLKALDGFNHSYAFTVGSIPEPIRIEPRDRAVVQASCLECHGDMVTAISHLDSPTPTDCLTCHSGVGHLLTQ